MSQEYTARSKQKGEHHRGEEGRRRKQRGGLQEAREKTKTAGVLLSQSLCQEQPTGRFQPCGRNAAADASAWFKPQTRRETPSPQASPRTGPGDRRVPLPRFGSAPPRGPGRSAAVPGGGGGAGTPRPCPRARRAAPAGCRGPGRAPPADRGASGAAGPQGRARQRAAAEQAPRPAGACPGTRAGAGLPPHKPLASARGRAPIAPGPPRSAPPPAESASRPPLLQKRGGSSWRWERNRIRAAESHPCTSVTPGPLSLGQALPTEQRVLTGTGDPVPACPGQPHALPVTICAAPQSQYPAQPFHRPTFQPARGVR